MSDKKIPIDPVHLTELIRNPLIVRIVSILDLASLSILELLEYNSRREINYAMSEVFKSKYDIEIILSTHAYKIDRFRKQVYTTDLQSGKETIFDYDSLVVATGARAVIPNIKGVNQEGVYFIRNYNDGVKIKDSTITKHAHSCVIAG